jgi:hypothetical protein
VYIDTAGWDGVFDGVGFFGGGVDEGFGVADGDGAVAG